MILSSQLTLGYVFLCALSHGVVVLAASKHATDSEALSGYHQRHREVGWHDIIQAPHVEAHIVFLNSERRVIPAKEYIFAPVGTVMREDLKNLYDAVSRVASQTKVHETAIKYLERSALFANVRAQGKTRFLAVLRQLYDIFADTQNRLEGELLIPPAPELCIL